MTIQRFTPGQVVATPGALEALAEAQVEPLELLLRHLSGDWGDLCKEDQQENEIGLWLGLRLLSCYMLSTGVRIWLITEADRSSSTFLLPDEY